jgi:uncharacterized membrane protein
MLTTGELAKEAGVLGAAGIVQQTLFAQFKGYLTRLYGEISSIGQSLLDPFKRSLFDVFIIIRKTFRRISSDLITFAGKGKLLDTLVSAVDKLANFSVHLFRKFLPQADGFFGRINKVYTAMFRYTKRFLQVLQPLREGGKIVIDMFGKPLAEVFKGFGRNIKQLAELGAKNKDKFLSFGESLKNVIAAFFDMSAAFKEIFTEAIPIINKVLDAIALLMRGIADIFRMFSKAGPLAAFLPVFLTLAAALKGKRGGGGGGRGFFYGALGMTNGIPGGMSGATGGGKTSGVQLTRTLSNVSGSSSAGGGASAITAAAGSLQSAAASLTAAAGTIAASAGGSMASSRVRNAPVGAIVPGHGLGGRYRQTADGRFIDPRTNKPIPYSGSMRYDADRYFQHLNKDLPVTTKNVYDPQVHTPYTPYSALFRNLAQNKIGNTIVGPNQDPNYATYGINALGGMGMRSSGTPVTGFGLIPLLNNNRPQTAAGVTTAAQQAAAMQQLNAAGAARMSRFQAFQSHRRAGGGFFSGLFGMTGAAGPGGAGGPISNRYHNFLPNARTAGQTIKQYGRAIKYASAARAAKIKGGLSNTFMSMTGSSLMSGAYRQAILDQQAAHLQAGGDPKTFKARRGQATKAALKANMGVGTMMLGAGASYLSSKYGSPEAQGALQSGSALMTVSPLAGAAVMGLGTASSAQTTTGGVLSGALGGAAAGALIGSFIPGVGTALGALVGAGAGAIFGWIKSDRNKKKMRKEAQDQISKQNLIPIVSAMIEGQTSVANTLAKTTTERMKKLASSGAAAQNAELDRLLKEGVISKEQRERAFADPNARKDLFAGLAKDAVQQQRVATLATGRMDEQIRKLQQATGLTKEEIISLSHKMGFNLVDDTKTLKEAMEGLGKSFKKTAKELDNAVKDAVLNALDRLEKFKTQSELGEAVDAAQNAFNASPNMDAIKSVISEMTLFLQAKYPDNQFKVIGSLFEMFDPKSPNYVLGNPKILGDGFSKLSPEKQKEMLETIQNEFLNPAIVSVAGVGTTQIGGKLAEANLFSDEKGMAALDTKIQEILKSGDQNRIDKLQAYLKYGNFAGMTAVAAQSKLEDVLGLPQGSLNFRLTEGTDKQLTLSTDDRQLMTEIINAAATGFNTKPAWWDNDTPDWWARGLQIKGDKIVPVHPSAEGNDTRTPRRGVFGDTVASKRLKSTLGAHASINGRLTGKRTITSSLRSTYLGSPSSDHAAGAAYDLTGQNLGQYAKMVRNGGGFAEFHGVNANRHLHVVPRVGDTSTTKDKNGYSTAHAPSVTINVYPSHGMDIDALVAKMMRMQQKAMRDINERM